MIKVLLPIILALNMPLQAQMSKNQGISRAQADGRYVNVTGDTMTGQLNGTNLSLSGTLSVVGDSYLGTGAYLSTFTASGGSFALPGPFSVGEYIYHLGDMSTFLRFQDSGTTFGNPVHIASSMTIAGNDGGTYGLTVSSNVSLAGLLYTNAGKVGVGISPSYRLHVVGDSVNRIAYFTDNANTGVSFLASGAGAKITSDGGTSLLFGDGTDVNMAIDATGNVGIGTTAPPAKLSVSTATTSVSFYSMGGAKTKAEILAFDPAGPGESFYCTDCVSSTVCISTGAAVLDFADIGDRTVACE